ncbi:hypothetical protein [Planctomycetes bacterium CA13]|uniref:hypothetical protein n=1 Tax=Novipirellula herctigrandis TaxID=2527986 RepID=UPI0011B8196D
MKTIEKTVSATTRQIHNLAVTEKKLVMRLTHILKPPNIQLSTKSASRPFAMGVSTQSNGSLLIGTPISIGGYPSFRKSASWKTSF